MTWARSIELDEIDSTNAEAMRHAARGERGPLWITARSQTQGRGRSGRTWVSGHGNLAASLLFAPGCDLAKLPELALVSGVATLDAIAAMTDADGRAALRLKWPNDVLSGRAKVAGILIESSNFGDTVLAVVGVGINVGSAPVVLDRAVATLAVGGTVVDASALARRLSETFESWLGIWNTGRGFGAIRAAWLERAGSVGEPMTINSAAGPVAGRFAGIDLDGALLLDSEDGRRQKFSFGDVTIPAC